MSSKTLKFGLIGRLLAAILVGIVVGLWTPEPVVGLFVTISSVFSTFLKFMIPFIIIAFVVEGISELRQGAGKLLGITVGLSYLSTLIAGLLAFVVANLFFDKFIDSSRMMEVLGSEEHMVASWINLPLTPIMEVTAAITFAFLMGLGIAHLRNQGKGQRLYEVFKEFAQIVELVLRKVIVPGLPLYIAGTFANIAYSGQIVMVMSVFWKVIVIVILLHWLVMLGQFSIAGALTKKNPIALIKAQLPAYITAVGTQSSVATIPVNLESSKAQGVSKEIREFVIPLCSTIHLSGSITSIVSFSMAALMMSGMPHDLGLMLPYIIMLGVVMVAAPGAPGGAVMSALPLFAMVGIGPESALASLIVALHITQDGFGTAANISGDNAIANIVDWIKKNR